MHLGIDGNEANIKKRVGSNIYASALLSWFHRLDSKNTFTVYLKSEPLPDLPIARKNWKYRILKPSRLWTRWRLPLDLYIHLPRPDVFFTPGHYAPQVCPMPSAISVMDLSFIHYPELFRKRDLYTLTRWTRQSIKHANHIFTISRSSKDDIIKFYSVPEEKISVTYPGWDRKQFIRPISLEEISNVKRTYAVGGEYLLYVGTLQPRKNLVRLIQGFAATNTPEVKLVIAGKKGWQYEEILQEADRIGIGERVRFTGFVSEQDKPALMLGARALVNVSLYEGFGIPVLEAMALGVPTIVSDGSSLAELVEDTGIRVSPTDVKSITRGITRSLQITEDQRNEMAVKSRNRARQFSWKRSAQQTLEVLHELALYR